MTTDNETVTTVDAWLSPGCNTVYSVSLCNSDGEEIRCIGGANSADDAWEMACDEAEDQGVPARLIPREDGVVTREWTPR